MVNRDKSPVVQFTGLMRSPASWAKVNRELSEALRSLDDMSVVTNPVRGFLWDSDFPEEQESEPVSSDPELEIGFAFPPQLSNYESSDNPFFNLSVYEATHLPPDWIEPLNTHCDRILVPSEHTLETYKRSGVDDQLLQLVPFGFNADRVEIIRSNYNPKNQDSLQIITLATPHHRKGLDLIEPLHPMIESETVDWTIHSPYEPDPDDHHFWEDPYVLRKLQENGFSVSVETLSDREILQLLLESDLCVQPSRSEGFGLAILESMAMGTPVITSNWGGHLDFKGPGMITVDGNLRPARDCQYAGKHPDAQVFEPNRQALEETIQSLINNPGRLDELGQQANDTAEGWTWTRSAKILRSCVRKYLDSQN